MIRVKEVMNVAICLFTSFRNPSTLIQSKAITNVLFKHKSEEKSQNGSTTNSAEQQTLT